MFNTSKNYMARKRYPRHYNAGEKLGGTIMLWIIGITILFIIALGLG